VQPLDFYRGIVRTYVAPVLAGATPPHAVIGTGHGEIVLELASAEAPLTVHNFLSLIEQGYYRDTRWHRVVPNFVIQDGDPTGTGSGGPGWAIRDEINRHRYEAAVLGMALSGPDTGGSQWFITLSPQPHLDGGYTVFGRVVGGHNVVPRVLQGDHIRTISRSAAP
jgi:cyclophilin family peptidyl-prolyl cis-trans isomerase